MKKITKKELKRLEKKEDKRRWKEVRIKVLERDNYQCLLCDSSYKLNVHHLIEKEFLMFRYLKFDVRNLITVCPRCHKFGEFSIHKNPLYALSIVQKMYPDNYKFLLAEVNAQHDKQED